MGWVTFARSLAPKTGHFYVIEITHLTVREESRPINGMAPLRYGSQPIDGGHTIFGAEERDALLAVEPDAAPFLHPYIGAREYLQGGERWILALDKASPVALARLPRVRERIAAVHEYRLTSKRTVTRELASFPTEFASWKMPPSPISRCLPLPCTWPGCAMSGAA